MKKLYFYFESKNVMNAMLNQWCTLWNVVLHLLVKLVALLTISEFKFVGADQQILMMCSTSLLYISVCVCVCVCVYTYMYICGTDLPKGRQYFANTFHDKL